MSTDMQAVVHQLGQLGRDLEQAVDELTELEMVAIDAEGDYKVAFSREFREAAGSIEVRKQVATAQTDDLWRTWGKAAAAVRLQKEHLKALHTRIDIGRSLFSAHKAEIALAGSGATP